MNRNEVILRNVRQNEVEFFKSLRKEWYNGNKKNWASGYVTSGTIGTNNELENYKKESKLLKSSSK